MIALLIAASGGTLAYVFLLWYYLRHWSPETTPSTIPDTAPFCSIVIAARNEEACLATCLQSVLHQTYPRDRFEVIVVDDQSEDRTAQIAGQFPEVLLKHTTPESHGKKQALSLGIEAARGEIVVITDADCTVTPGWLRAVVAAFDEHTQMVTGPVLCLEVASAFGRFQALDLAGLACITAAGLQSGLHHLANGANMAFRRSAFNAVHGLSEGRPYASGDDLFLAQSIAAKYPQGLRYVWPADGIVHTRPCPTVQTFLRQRVRWASKNAGLPEKPIHYIWIMIWCIFVLDLATVFRAFFATPGNIVIALLPITALLAAEYFFLRRVVRFYGMKQLQKGYVVSALMHYAYVVSMGFLVVLQRQYSWKGRQVR